MCVSLYVQHEMNISFSPCTVKPLLASVNFGFLQISLLITRMKLILILATITEVASFIATPKFKIIHGSTRLFGLGGESIKNNARSGLSQFNAKSWLKTSAIALSFLSFSLPAFPPEAIAADTVKVGKCLLQSCQKELAQCILNPKCLANVICLNTCNGRKDEAECQIKCGDLFENDVVGVFNACAVRYGGKNNLIYNYLQKSSVNLLLKSKEMCPTKAR